MLVLILVFIDPQPPQGLTPVQWHNTCMRALGEWLIPAGAQIAVTDDRSKAHITITVAPIYPLRGKTRFPYHIEGVQLPVKGTWIFIDYGLVDCYPVLLHEIGHAIGLKHRTNSVMSFSPQRLTHVDFQSIEELRNVIKATCNIGPN